MTGANARPVARTLAEAHTYLGLRAAAQTDADEPTLDRTDTVEGERGWILTWSDRVEVQVPYASEQAAGNVGSRYGLGVSRLIDAAQWVQVADTYAERAIAAITGANAGSAGQQAQTELEIRSHWEVAAAAVDEALKFFAAGPAAHELPEPAVWTDQGRRFAQAHPERLSRQRLLDDLEYYRGALADLTVRIRSSGTRTGRS